MKEKIFKVLFYLLFLAPTMLIATAPVALFDHWLDEGDRYPNTLGGILVYVLTFILDYLFVRVYFKKLGHKKWLTYTLFVVALIFNLFMIYGVYSFVASYGLDSGYL